MRYSLVFSNMAFASKITTIIYFIYNWHDETFTYSQVFSILTEGIVMHISQQYSVKKLFQKTTCLLHTSITDIQMISIKITMINNIKTH